MHHNTLTLPHWPVPCYVISAAESVGVLPPGCSHRQVSAFTPPGMLICPAALPCHRPDRDALLKSTHDLVEKAGVVKDGWNGYNVIHDNASRVAALDIGFAPRSVPL